MYAHTLICSYDLHMTLNMIVISLSFLILLIIIQFLIIIHLLVLRLLSEKLLNIYLSMQNILF